MGSLRAWFRRVVGLFERRQGVSQIAHIRLSYPVLAFTGAVSLVTAVLAGLAPAFEGSRADFAALKNGVRQIGSDIRSRRLREGLVIAELALAAVLLVGAGLMLRSFAACAGSTRALVAATSSRGA